MAGINISVRVKSPKNLVKKGGEHLRTKVPKIADKRLLNAAREIKKRMSKPGKPIKYPVQWDNDRQRIAVIIKLKGSRRAQRKTGGWKNLPYRRTNTHIKGFKVTSIKSGYSVKNTKRTSIYLYGDVSGQGQSRIHQGRHPLFRRQADIVIRGLPKTVNREMVALAKRMPTQ